MNLLLRNYRFTFDWKALLLFVLVMVPNVVWMCLPWTTDVLHNGSAYPAVGVIARIFQVVAVACLIFVGRREKPKHGYTTVLFSVLSLVVYYVAWAAYFAKIDHAAVILSLSLFGGLSLLFYGIDRRNLPAVVFTGLFLVFHFTASLLDFIL